MKLGIIIPAYNEGDGLQNAVQALENLWRRQLSSIVSEVLVLFIDDGSQDDSWSILKEIKSDILTIHAIKFSRNFGHQAALMAGIKYMSDKVDAHVCIDADLQHDIDVIPKFLELHQQGNEIVYGVKRSRGDEKILKKILSLFFYKLLKFMGVNVIENHADFRLMGIKSTKELLKFSEKNLYLRGLIPNLGFKTEKVYYDVKDRTFGESKYNIRRMMSLALNGITSFGDLTGLNQSSFELYWT